MAFKIKRFISASPIKANEGPGDKVNEGPGDEVKMRTDAEILKQYKGAIKVRGKLNEFNWKGVTLNPARYPSKNKGKTVKEAIKIKNQK